MTHTNEPPEIPGRFSLADLAVYKDGLTDTWDWIDDDYTLVTYPGVGHIPHLEVPDKVTKAIRGWLNVH